MSPDRSVIHGHGRSVIVEAGQLWLRPDRYPYGSEYRVVSVEVTPMDRRGAPPVYHALLRSVVTDAELRVRCDRLWTEGWTRLEPPLAAVELDRPLR